MFRSTQRLRLVQLVAAAATVTAIAACDTPTQPSAPTSRLDGKPAAIEGDTTNCHNGWVIIEGRYVCNGS